MSGRVSGGQFVGEFSAPTFSAGISLTSNGRTQSVSIQPRGGDISDVRISDTVDEGKHEAALPSSSP